MSSGAQPELRMAGAEDADFLVSVLFRADEGLLRQQGAWDEEAFRQQSRQRTAEEVAGRVDDSTTYVIHVDGAAVGRLRLVRPGQGIGTRVLGMVAAEAVGGQVPVTLHVGKRNPDARRLYERLGFRVVAEEGTRERMAMNSPVG